jgi:hypothetical protein
MTGAQPQLYGFLSPKTGKWVAYTKEELRQQEEGLDRIIKYSEGTRNPPTIKKRGII